MATLKQSELDALRAELKKRYQQTLGEVREELENRGDMRLSDLMNHEPGDNGDESLARELADINLTTLERQVRELADIEAAFQRMRDGSYGVCIECGEPIAPARLKAYPTAKRCIECQEAHERRRAVEGDGIPPSL